MKKIILICYLAFLTCTDSFAQWAKINAIPTQDIVALTVYGNTILAATDSNLIYKSNDGGMNWDTLIVSNSPLVIISLKVIDDSIYVGTNSNGIYCSADNGSSWSKKGNNLLP